MIRTIQEIKLNETERYKKFLALKIIGITVKTYKSLNREKLVISVDGNPDIDKCIDNTFNNVDDILRAFSDELRKQNIKIAA